MNVTDEEVEDSLEVTTPDIGFPDVSVMEKVSVDRDVLSMISLKTTFTDDTNVFGP